MIELEKFEQNDGVWRVRMTDHCSSFDSEDIWDVPTEAAADSLINAMNYAYAIGEGVHIRDSEELRRIREVWEKHGLTKRGRDLCMALNEVLLHYKGFLKAEKQDRTENVRRSVKFLRRDVAHLKERLALAKEGKWCFDCEQSKDYCQCALRHCLDAAKKEMEYVHTKRFVLK